MKMMTQMTMMMVEKTMTNEDANKHADNHYDDEDDEKFVAMGMSLDMGISLS